jgi:hypothetical protein
MIIKFSADTIVDAGIEKLIDIALDIRQFYRNIDYGNNDIELFFVINCVGDNTKLRKYFSKKDKVLYWDVILSYSQVKAAPMEEKKKILVNAIIDSFDILKKYKQLGVDYERIKDDTRRYFTDLGWL